MLTTHFRATGPQVDFMRAALRNHLSRTVAIHHLPNHAATAAHTTPGGQVATTHSVFHVPEIALDFEVVLDWRRGHTPAVRVRPIVGYIPFDPTQHGGTLETSIEAALAYTRELVRCPA